MHASMLTRSNNDYLYLDNAYDAAPTDTSHDCPYHALTAGLLRPAALPTFLLSPKLCNRSPIK